MSKRTKVIMILSASAVGVSAVIVTTVNSVRSGIRQPSARTLTVPERPDGMKPVSKGPKGETYWSPPVSGPKSKGMATKPVTKPKSDGLSPEAEARVRARIEAMDYWWDPAEHFTVQDLRVFKSTRVSGLGKITGQVTNVGTRDAQFLSLTFRLLDAQGRRVGRATAVNHNGLESGEVWDFEAVLAAHASGGVQVQLDPNGVTAY